MAGNTLKITGMFEIEIELPSGMSFSMASNQPQPDPAPASKVAGTIAAGKSRNQEIADRIAAFIREAGPAGATRHQITRRFSQIKNRQQREAILDLLPSLFFRRSRDKPKKGNRGAERWTYFYADRGQ